jgi:hypothetical protein
MISGWLTVPPTAAGGSISHPRPMPQVSASEPNSMTKHRGVDMVW